MEKTLLEKHMRYLLAVGTYDNDFQTGLIFKKLQSTFFLVIDQHYRNR